MAQERHPLEPAQVAKVYQILRPHLDEPRKRQFVASSREWGAARRRHLDIVSQIPAPVSFDEDLEHANQQLQIADGQIKATQDFIDHPYGLKGGLAAVRAKYFHKEHPWITSIKDEKREVEVSKGKKVSEAMSQNNAQAQVRRQLEPQIRSAEGERTTAESRLLGVCEGVAIRDWPTTVRYLGVLPYRAMSTAERFGNTFYLDPSRVPDLPGFKNVIGPQIASRARVPAYRALADPKNLPLRDIPGDDLPDPVKQALKGWTQYQYAMRLHEAGLLPQRPELSKFLKT